MIEKELTFLRDLKCEIVHYYNPSANTSIRSFGRYFHIEIDDQGWSFALPLSIPFIFFSLFRITRRLFRLDKSNAVFTYNKEAIIILFRGGIYRFDLSQKSLLRVGELNNCRNVLHCGVAVTRGGIFLGEYGDNKDRNTVDIIVSKDDGYSWSTVYQFPKGTIKHIHGVYSDPYTDRLWIPTGDFEGECYLISSDYAFNDVIRYGDGTQKWRAVGLFFTEKEVIWAMDSPLEVSTLQRFDRSNCKLTQGMRFPGPVWYVKQLSDGVSLVQTTVEIGPGVLTNSSCLYASVDFEHWECIASFEKDCWPMPYFKWGVIGFADGEQTSHDFAFFAEALKGLDGRGFAAKLTVNYPV